MVVFCCCKSLKWDFFCCPKNRCHLVFAKKESDKVLRRWRKTMNNIYESKDKQKCPFLLIQPGINFLGTRISNSIVYFQFSPLNKCQQLVNKFISKSAPPVQPKELLDAVETFRDIIFEMKEKRSLRSSNQD